MLLSKVEIRNFDRAVTSRRAEPTIVRSNVEASASRSTGLGMVKGKRGSKIAKRKSHDDAPPPKRKKVPKTIPAKTKVKKEQQKAKKKEAQPPVKRSKWVGVCWNKRKNKWAVQFNCKTLGTYLDENEAARVYDEQAILFGKPVNFPLEEGQEQAVKPMLKGTLAMVPNADKPSKYVGVSWNLASKRWMAAIRMDQKTKNLGLFHDEKEAACTYDDMAAVLGRPVNFPLLEGQKQAKKPAPKGSGKRQWRKK